ncbi:MAG: phosphotransferase [Pauljensenia sp.]
MTRSKTPYELAALATVAVPRLEVAGLRPPQFSDEVLSVTGLIDTSGDRWMVVCPHDTVGGLDMEAQNAVLERLGKAHDFSKIPFEVPRPAGFTRTPEGDRVMVHRDLGGHVMETSDFDDPHLLPASLGNALASLHNLPELIYTGVNLPAYSAIECRDRHQAVLDEAAQEVVIPANLWDRWEESLENLSLWRFLPSPIHGDLSETSIHVDHGRVCALTGFSSAHVGDPAVDIAWVFARASDEFLERFHEAYQQTRSEKDLHLLERAELLSELAVVRWLVHGLHSGDSEIVDEARAMLAELSASVGESTPKRTEEPVKTANDSATSEEESSSQREDTTLRRSESAPESPLNTEVAQRDASTGTSEAHARPHSGPIRLSARTSKADSEGASEQAAEAPTEHIDMSAILPTHE